MQKKQEKISISCAFSERKMEALELYAQQKDLNLEEQIAQFLEAKYRVIVPKNVRNYIALFIEGQCNSGKKTGKRTPPAAAPGELDPQLEPPAGDTESTPETLTLPLSNGQETASQPAHRELESETKPSEAPYNPSSFWG